MLLPLRRQKRSPKQPSRSYLPKDLSGENGIVATTIQLRRAAIPWLVPLQFASNDSPTVAILVRDPDRVLALLHQRRVVDHQDGVRSTNHTVGFLSQKLLQGRTSPRRSRQKVLQWPPISRRDALCHRLDALALAGTEQALHVQRHPAPLRHILQAIQKRRQPVFEFFSPIHSRSR